MKIHGEWHFSELTSVLTMIAMLYMAMITESIVDGTCPKILIVILAGLIIAAAVSDVIAVVLYKATHHRRRRRY